MSKGMLSLLLLLCVTRHLLFAGDLQPLRPYLPNILFSDGKAAAPQLVLPMLALVAVRELQDEEVLLNYRLSNYIARPSWYTPVDSAEDKRRWA